jgi:hypothetical protein
MNQRLAFIFILLFSLFSSIKAQQFIASTNQKQVGLGESFVVSFKINSDGGDHFSPPANINVFDIAGGPNISSMMTNDNGRFSASTTYSFILLGMTVGKFRLTPARIWVNGKPIVSNSLDIEVVAGKTGGSNGTNQKAVPIPAPNSPSANLSPEMQTKLERGIFLQARPDKKEAYIGEQIYLSYRIYTLYNFGQPRQIEPPVYEGFWVEDLKPGIATAQIENINGKNYNIFDVKKSFLYPQKAGDLSIPAYKLQTNVEVEGQGKNVAQKLWQRFFGGNVQGPDLVQEIPYTLTSKPLTIKVKPLPENGKPSNFTGAVGSFSMQMNCDKKSVPNGEPFELTLTFQGEGNLKMIEAPKLNFPPGFEVEEPENEDDIQKSTQDISGIRVFRYTITPTEEGNFEIPAISFSFFNPKTERYDSLQSTNFNLNVTKGTATSAGANGKNENSIFKDIAQESGKIHALNSPILGKWGFLGTYFSLFFGFIGWIFYKRKQAQNQPDTIIVQAQNAHKVANIHLAKAKIFLEKRETKAFYKEVSDSLWGYLADKLKLKTANLSRENVTLLLGDLDVSENITQNLIYVLDECEMALFAPFSNEEGMRKCYENAANVINSLEEKLGKEKNNR